MLEALDSDRLARAKPPRRLDVVLAVRSPASPFGHGDAALRIALLDFGTGLRDSKIVDLRIKDVNSCCII